MIIICVSYKYCSVTGLAVHAEPDNMRHFHSKNL